MPTDEFSKLIGRVIPLKTIPVSPDFGKKPKVRAHRKIDAQNNRSNDFPQPYTTTTTIIENYDNIPTATIYAMQREAVHMERIIDLHGLFVDEALRLLDDALIERRNRRPVYWQIIHGKGRNSPIYDKAPLKAQVIEHLRTHSAISALVSIHDSRGESGAVMVRLRKKSRK